ncbi:hypothetical protein [Nonomuraea typhae]|uniref:DUF1906 domain-containing protein n=1 Tax=Nonomuraea typhae TaxID=2603600 RepID=A0ABW7YYX0_9ACTN
MLKRVFLAAIMLTALAGCAGTGGALPEPAATADKKHRMEAIRAACMKQHGFKYIAFVPPEKEKSGDELQRLNGDYLAMRKYREKYGFGIFAPYVYPAEKAQIGSQTERNPNEDISGKLSAAQRDSYAKAEVTCFVQAARRVLGKTVKSRKEFYDQFGAAKRDIVAYEINDNPWAVNLAGDMAACLRDLGYSVPKVTPREISLSTQQPFHDQLSKIGQQQNLFTPAPGSREIVMPELSPAEARPYLEKEIKAALDDLECGADFYALYEPMNTEVNNRLFAEFAM